MAKRYKGYKKLNQMIDELENTVITVDEITGEPITPTIVTKKSISQPFQNIIDKKTGRFLSYQQAKAKTYKNTKQNLTYKEYQEQIHSFQDLSISDQLTLEGEMKYHIDRGIAIFGKDMMDEIIDTVGYSNYRLLIDRIGKLSNTYLEKSSQYTSNTFYDLFNIVIENIENGVSITDAFDTVKSVFDEMYG